MVSASVTFWSLFQRHLIDGCWKVTFFSLEYPLDTPVCYFILFVVLPKKKKIKFIGMYIFLKVKNYFLINPCCSFLGDSTKTKIWWYICSNFLSLSQTFVLCFGDLLCLLSRIFDRVIEDITRGIKRMAHKISWNLDLQ